MPEKQDAALPGWGYGAAGAIPAALMYALARRARPGLYGRAATQRARQHGIHRSLVPEDLQQLKKQRLSKLLSYLSYGTTHVGDSASAAGKKRFVLDPSSYTGRDLRFFGLDDKLKESKALHKLLPGMAPKTQSMAGVLGGKAPKLNDPRLQQWLERRLRQRVGKQWILKGRGDFQSAGTLISDTSDLAAIIRRARQMRESTVPHNLGMSLKQFRKLEQTDPAAYVALLKGSRGRSGDPHFAEAWRLYNYLRKPSSGLVQRRANLGSSLLGRPEFRMHVVNGKVVPGTQARLSYTRAFLGQLGLDPQARQVAKQVGPALERALARRKLKSNLALDIGLDAKGKPVIFEANANSASGFLNSTPGWGIHESFSDALTNHHLISAIQGRNTHLLAGLKGLGAGAVGVGGYGAARQIAGDRNAQTGIG